MDSIAPLKHCIKCATDKPLDEFGRDKRRPDGLFPYCKRCRLKDPLKSDIQKANKAAGLRYCSACTQWLTPDNFYRNIARQDGIHHHCKKCSISQAVEKYHSESVEDHREKERRRRHNRPLRFRQWYQKNAASQRKRTLVYSRTPRGKAIQARANHRRRSLEKSNPATLSDQEWQYILEKQDHRCLACQKPFSDELPPTRDHIIPVTKGGSLTFDNCQALCKPCNSSKRDRTIDYRPASMGSDV